MNYQVETEGKSPEEVATAFLKEGSSEQLMSKWRNQYVRN